MRTCLLTGGYPYGRDALGGWCSALVRGLSAVRFDLLAVGDRELPGVPAHPLPPNAATSRSVALPRDDRHRGDRFDPATAAAWLLCRGLLGDPEETGEMFTAGLTQLAHLARPGESPLAGVPLADVLVDAARTGADQPRLSLRDARTGATLLRHATRALAVEVPESDLVHCVGGTAPLLAALAQHWRTGVPLLLTEARPPAPGPAEESQPPTAHTIRRLFRRAVTRTGYAAAGLIAPLSEHHRRRALADGADPGRLVPVPVGVDPGDFPAAGVAGGEAVIVWAGSGGPGSGIESLLEAFGRVVADAPAAVLQLTGVAAVHEEHAVHRVDRTGLGDRIKLRADFRGGYPAGTIEVHLPGLGDPPARLAEAMMSGRAVIGVDVGPVAETLGGTGLLVPENDPAALAAACLELLHTPQCRQALGEAARRRALACFTTDRMVRAYGALYADLAGPAPATAFELELAGPAPRAALPTTVRWLTAQQRSA